MGMSSSYLNLVLHKRISHQQEHLPVEALLRLLQHTLMIIASLLQMLLHCSVK